MLIKTLCLGVPPAPGFSLAEAAGAARGGVPGLRAVHLLKVLRHISSDSVREDRSHSGVTAAADRIDSVVECYFDDAAALAAAQGAPAWQAFLQAIPHAGAPLFSLDTFSNVPIPPEGAAAQGGFRRWMLLARKAATSEQFRDGWFGRHAELVQQLPQIDGYLQNLVTARYDAAGRPVGYDEMPIDGVAELCFASESAMNASYTSDARLPLRDDARELLGRITTVLVQGEAFR